MLNKYTVGLVAAVATLALGTGIASAQAYDPTTEATSMATSAASSMGPLVFAVLGAFVVVALAFWAARFVLRTVKKGGS